MSSKQIAPVTARFEALKLTNEYNAEYWSSRDRWKRPMYAVRSLKEFTYTTRI